MKRPEPIHDQHDPVWAAALAAPLDDEPETEDERAAYEQLLADLQANRQGTGTEEIRAAIEQMRREQASKPDDGPRDLEQLMGDVVRGARILSASVDEESEAWLDAHLAQTAPPTASKILPKRQSKVTFSAWPAVWIEIRGEKHEDSRRLRDDAGLVGRFQRWLSEQDIFEVAPMGKSGPGIFLGAFAPEDAERVVAWLREQGAEETKPT